MADGVATRFLFLLVNLSNQSKNVKQVIWFNDGVKLYFNIFAVNYVGRYLPIVNKKKRLFSMRCVPNVGSGF